MRNMIAGLALLTAPAMAQAADLTLWGNLNTGMTQAEAEKIAPKTVSLSDSCTARVDPSFKAGRLAEVALKYTDDNRAKCGETIRDGLTSKYGEPVKATSSEDVPYNTPKVSTTYTYRKDGLRVVLRLREDNGKWWLNYGADSGSIAASSL